MKVIKETASHKEKIREAAPRQTSLQSIEEPNQGEIQQRAYEIYIERGGAHGLDLDDWLQAKRELHAKHQAS